MRTFYEHAQGEIDHPETLADTPDGTTTTITHNLSALVKSLIRFSPSLPDFKDSSFYFEDGSAYNIDPKGKHSPAQGLDAATIKKTTLLLAYGLQGVSLDEAITKLEQLPEAERANVAAQLFGIDLKTTKKAAQIGVPTPGGKGHSTKAALAVPTADQVAKMVEFLKAHVSTEYEAQDIHHECAGSTGKVSGKWRNHKDSPAYMTAHKAITGLMVRTGLFKEPADTFEKIKAGLDAVEDEGLDKFTERLIAAAQAAHDQGLKLDDFKL